MYDIDWPSQAQKERRELKVWPMNLILEHENSLMMNHEHTHKHTHKHMYDVSMSWLYAFETSVNET